MILNNICPPALIYLIFSLTQIVIDTIKGQYNVAFLKIWVAVIFTILLNFLCQNGLGIISWIIVFIPFILMTLIISILLLMFGLDPTTGRVLVRDNEGGVPDIPGIPSSKPGCDQCHNCLSSSAGGYCCKASKGKCVSGNKKNCKAKGPEYLWCPNGTPDTCAGQAETCDTDTLCCAGLVCKQLNDDMGICMPIDKDCLDSCASTCALCRTRGKKSQDCSECHECRKKCKNSSDIETIPYNGVQDTYDDTYPPNDSLDTTDMRPSKISIDINEN